LNTEKETNDTMICLKTRSEQLQEIPFPTNTSTLTASENGGVWFTFTSDSGFPEFTNHTNWIFSRSNKSLSVAVVVLRHLIMMPSIVHDVELTLEWTLNKQA
jgi:hypothetical protein